LNFFLPFHIVTDLPTSLPPTMLSEPPQSSFLLKYFSTVFLSDRINLEGLNPLVPKITPG
jgi:hypothetical protein